MDIRLPILHMNADYILPVAEKNYGICGLKNYRSGCYEAARFIDSVGQEWFVESAEVLGYSSILQYLRWGNENKSIKVKFYFRMGKKYSFDELKGELEEFLLTKKLRGSPFQNKKKEVPLYMSKFNSLQQLVSEIGYFDSRAGI